MTVSPLNPGETGVGGAQADVTMAFQPIVDVERGDVFAYEALVRGVDGAPAEKLLARIPRHNRYRFDQYCRVSAIRMAAELGLDTRLSINFLPNAMSDPETCLSATVAAAAKFGVPRDQLIFELTEHEQVRNPVFLDRLRRVYHQQGFATAIDDFGAGFAGLQLLADFQPDIIKLDRKLIFGIAEDRTRRLIVRAVVRTASALNIRVVAEGVEYKRDLETVGSLGVTLCQGFLFGYPGVGRLPHVKTHV